MDYTQRECPLVLTMSCATGTRAEASDSKQQHDNTVAQRSQLRPPTGHTLATPLPS
jgi:hypothetical protein